MRKIYTDIIGFVVKEFGFNFQSSNRLGSRDTMKTMLFRMTRDTKVFRKGQKVFCRFSTGALAALVRGRYKKHGRWVDAWVHWADRDGKGFSGKPDCRFIGYARLDDSFKKLIGLV